MKFALTFIRTISSSFCLDVRYFMQMFWIPMQMLCILRQFKNVNSILVKLEMRIATLPCQNDVYLDVFETVYLSLNLVFFFLVNERIY